MEKSKKQNASPAEASIPDKRRPVASFAQGDVTASVWGREHPVRGVPTRFYSVTLERRYRDAAGRVGYTKSFDPDDLGAVIALCQQAGQAVQELSGRPGSATES